MVSVLRKLSTELGFAHLRAAHSPKDVALLILSRFIRMVGCVLVLPSRCPSTDDVARRQIWFHSSHHRALPHSPRLFRLERRALPLSDPLRRRCPRTVYQLDRGQRREAEGVGFRVCDDGCERRAFSAPPLSFFFVIVTDDLLTQFVFFLSRRFVVLLLAATFGVISP